MTPADDTTPYWTVSADFPRFEPLSGDITVDAIVVGGGITGLTAAYLLATAGRRVAVLERGRCAMTDTGHTTAHLTMVTDTRLPELVDRFGRDHARAVWVSGLAAINFIEDTAGSLGIDAGFTWVDGYLHEAPDAEPGREARSFRDEAALANDLGFDAEFVDEAPVVARPGIRFPGQARFHPRRYLAGLAHAIVAAGGKIYEHSEAGEFADSPRRVTVHGHTVRFEDAVIATHTPLVGLGGSTGAALFQTKLALYSTYAIAARVAKGALPDALMWDTADPYRYLRLAPQDGYDLAIFGGEDHKTGQAADTGQCYRQLEAQFARLVPDAAVVHRWAGQVIETPDGLPYIGESAERQYSATGYSGNGMTFGTLAGMMIADAILQRANPWAELYDPRRKALGRSLWDYIKENADYPYYMIRDRFAGPEGRSLRAVGRGEGKVIEHKGQTIAAHRTDAGVLVLRSAICTHMGCLVEWNDAERTWDCPCHGSRFKPSGDVISGPAESPLDPLES